MAVAIGEIKPGFLADDKANGTLIPIPPPNGGAIGWGGVWLSFGVDFADVVLRVAVYNATAKSWRITERLAVPQLGGRIGIPIQDGDQKVSVGRVKTGAPGEATAPVGWLLETTLHA